MNPAAIISLLTFLDTLFKLGGQLVEAAIQKAPELNITPLPDLKEMDKVRQDRLDQFDFDDKQLQLKLPEVKP